MDQVSWQLLELIRKINKTNVATKLNAEMTLSDAISQNSIYRDLVREASVTYDRYAKSEVKFKGTINVVLVQRRADALAKEHRELETKIQEANWLTELIE